KIPKPDGEAGRPGRGGYNLENALKWDAGRFKAFKQGISNSCRDDCNSDRGISSIFYICLMLTSFEALSHFSELNDYEGCWPIGDVIQMQLKNTSAKQR
ncbi:hypothetical protein C8R48DRAFT_546714, partial [Suillus tomentosus]